MCWRLVIKCSKWLSVDSDFDENEAAQPPAIAEAVETEDPEEGTDENYSGLDAALNKAEEDLDFVEVKEKKCHCRCKLGAGDTPCIDGFSDEERDSIRYILFIYDRRVIWRDGSVEIIFLSNWRIMLLYYYTLYPLRLMCLDACVKRVSFWWHFNHHSINFFNVWSEWKVV